MSVNFNNTIQVNNIDQWNALSGDSRLNTGSRTKIDIKANLDFSQTDNPSTLNINDNLVCGNSYTITLSNTVSEEDNSS